MRGKEPHELTEETFCTLFKPTIAREEKKNQHPLRAEAKQLEYVNNPQHFIHFNVHFPTFWFSYSRSLHRSATTNRSKNKVSLSPRGMSYFSFEGKELKTCYEIWWNT